MRLAIMAAAAAGPFLCSPAAAAEDEDERYWAQLYVAGRGTLEIADANQLRFRDGAGGILGAGLILGDRWRAEFAVSRRGTPIKQIPPIEADGSFSTWSHMLNVLYHLRSVDKRFSPFVGAGIGYNISKLEAFSTDPLNEGLAILPQRHTALSVQGIAGISYHVTRRVDLETAFAYFTNGDEDYDSTFPNNPTVQAAYRTFSVQVGARLRF